MTQFDGCNFTTCNNNVTFNCFSLKNGCKPVRGAALPTAIGNGVGAGGGCGYPGGPPRGP